LSIEARPDGLSYSRVDFGGTIKEACVSYVPDLRVGDFVLVHAGFALDTVDPEEAQKTLELLTQMDALAEQAEKDRP